MILGLTVSANQFEVNRAISKRQLIIKQSSFCHFNTSPEVIRRTVMMCVRFPLSLKNVEDSLHGAVYVFRAKRADRLKLIYWDGSGLVMSYKRLEQNSFKWPTVTDGVMRLDPAQFEALFAGLDWRRVTAREIAPPAAAE